MRERENMKTQNKMRERARSNIDSKELLMLLNCALDGLYHLRNYF
jgi:hypothetical protein